MPRPLSRAAAAVTTITRPRMMVTLSRCLQCFPYSTREHTYGYFLVRPRQVQRWYKKPHARNDPYHRFHFIGSRCCMELLGTGSSMVTVKRQEFVPNSSMQHHAAMVQEAPCRIIRVSWVPLYYSCSIGSRCGSMELLDIGGSMGTVVGGNQESLHNSFMPHWELLKWNC